MRDRIVTVLIGGAPRTIVESKLAILLKQIEKTKDYFISKGISKEIVEEVYKIEIIYDE